MNNASFWIFATLLMLATLALLIIPMLIKRRRSFSAAAGSNQGARAANISVYEDRLAQLQSEFERGLLDAEQLSTAKSEAQRQLLTDTAALDQTEQRADRLPIELIVGCLIYVPVVAYLLYGQFGSPQLLLTGEGEQSVSVEKLPQAALNQLAGLESAVRRTPTQLSSWINLSRAYQQAGRPQAAVDSWGQANQLAQGRDAEVLLGYAEALALAGGGRLRGEPERLVERALRLAPESPRALWFGGMAAMERQDFVAVEQRWGQLMKMDHPEQFRQVLQRGLQAARQQLAAQGGAPVQQPNPPRMSQPQAPNRSEADSAVDTDNKAAGVTVPGNTVPGNDAPGSELLGNDIPGIDVSVSVADSIAAELPTNATLFVYAKAQQGPPMPLAIKRLSSSSLVGGLTLRLTDADAMMPMMKLSNFDRWTVIARVSPTGEAIPQSGDWLAQADLNGDLAGELAVSLTLSEKIP